jgi:hypothetical protein
MIAEETTGYSAAVAIRLLVNDESLDVAQVSGGSEGGFLVLRDCREIQGGTAGRLIVTVDDQCFLTPILIPNRVPYGETLVNFL